MRRKRDAGFRPGRAPAAPVAGWPIAPPPGNRRPPRYVRARRPHQAPAPGARGRCRHYGEGVTETVAGLLLAAGGGRRLGGRPKALLPYRGGLLVEAVAGRLRRAGCDPVHVVLGAGAARVRRAARPTAGDGGGPADWVPVENPEWESGMGSSLRAGLRSLPPGTPAVLVALVDQPGIGADALERVRRACRGPGTLAAAAYGGRRGHPVLLGADHLPQIARLARGDHGARGYLRAHEAEITLVEVGDIAVDTDLDTPADLHVLREDP